jgi:CreA protein
MKPLHWSSNETRVDPPKRLWKRGSRVKLCFMATVLFVAALAFARADELSCISTTFNLLSPNDKVCVTDFDDPKVPGVTCHISQARKGGWGQPLGLNEDPSNFSVACRQVGPINVDISKLTDDEEVFSEKTSIIFKATRIYRMLDKKHNTLVYVAEDRQWFASQLHQLRADHAMGIAMTAKHPSCSRMTLGDRPR